AILAEERLTYFALSGKMEQLRELFRTLISTLVSPRGRSLAGWAARAIPRLPNNARELEEARMLAFGSRLRLADLGIPQTFNDLDNVVGFGALPEWTAWLTPMDLGT